MEAVLAAAAAVAAVADADCEAKGVPCEEAVAPACDQEGQSCQARAVVPKVLVRSRAEGSAEAEAFRTYPAAVQSDQAVRMGQEVGQAGRVAEWMDGSSFCQPVGSCMNAVSNHSRRGSPGPASAEEEADA